MRREWVLRIRLSRPVAVALLAASFVGTPAVTISQGVTQTFSFTTSVPEPRVAYRTFNSFSHTTLGTAGTAGNILFNSNQNCAAAQSAYQAAAMPSPWTATPPAGSYNCAGAASGQPVRTVTINGLRRSGTSYVPDYHDVGQATPADKLFVVGDIAINGKLCFNDNNGANSANCISWWPPEPGITDQWKCDSSGTCGNSCAACAADTANCQANGASPVYYTQKTGAPLGCLCVNSYNLLNCQANQTKSNNSLHLQYVLHGATYSVTTSSMAQTSSGKTITLWAGHDGPPLSTTPLWEFQLNRSGWDPACYWTNQGVPAGCSNFLAMSPNDPLCNTACKNNMTPPAGSNYKTYSQCQNPTTKAFSSAGPAAAGTTACASGLTAVLDATCNYAYRGSDGIIDCFYKFPSTLGGATIKYAFYFDARW